MVQQAALPDDLSSVPRIIQSGHSGTCLGSCHLQGREERIRGSRLFIPTTLKVYTQPGYPTEELVLIRYVGSLLVFLSNWEHTL